MTSHPHLAQLIEQSIAERNKGDYLGALRALEQARQYAPTDVAIHLALATTHIELKQFTQALQVLDETVILAPRRAEVFEARAVTLREMGKLKEAESALREALNCVPGDEARVRIALAQVIEVQGDGSPVIEEYEQACKIDAANAENFRLLGDAYLRAKRYEDAKNAYVAGVKLNEDHARLHLGIGITEGFLGNDKRALSAIRKATRLAPDDSEIQLNMGIAFEKTGANEEAIQSFQRATQLEPENSKYHSFLGTALANAGHFEEAIKSFEQSVKLNPNNPETQLLLQMALLAHGERDVALANTRRLVEQYPQNAMVQNALAFILVAMGQPNEASTCLDEALRLDPERPEFYSNKAFLLRMLGQLDEALAIAKHATEIAGDNPMAWYSAGMAYLSAGSAEDARNAFTTAIHLKPDLVEGHIGLSMALIQLGEHEQAEKVLEYVVERVDGDNLPANLNLAIVYSMMGKPEKAKRHINRALERFPDKAETHILRGQLLMVGGNEELAEESFRKAVGIDPKNPIAKFALALILGHRYQSREAVILLKQAIALAPKFAPAYAYLASIFRSLGCREEAMVIAQIAVDLDRQSPLCVVMLAETLRALNQYAEALELCEQVFALAPNYDLAYELKARIFAENERCEEALAIMRHSKLAEESDFGSIFLLHDNFDQAIASFNKYEQLNNNWPAYLLGMAYLLRGETDRAMEQYRKATEKDRQNQFSCVRNHLRTLSWYATKKSDRASLLEPAITFLKEICARENVPSCPEISDITALLPQNKVV